MIRALPCRLTLTCGCGGGRRMRSLDGTDGRSCVTLAVSVAAGVAARTSRRWCAYLDLTQFGDTVEGDAFLEQLAQGGAPRRRPHPASPAQPRPAARAARTSWPRPARPDCPWPLTEPPGPGPGPTPPGAPAPCSAPPAPDLPSRSSPPGDTSPPAATPSCRASRPSTTDTATTDAHAHRPCNPDRSVVPRSDPPWAGPRHGTTAACRHDGPDGLPGSGQRWGLRR